MQSGTGRRGAAWQDASEQVDVRNGSRRTVRRGALLMVDRLPVCEIRRSLCVGGMRMLGAGGWGRSGDGRSPGPANVEFRESARTSHLF